MTYKALASHGRITLECFASLTFAFIEASRSVDKLGAKPWSCTTLKKAYETFPDLARRPHNWLRSSGFAPDVTL